jgi:hypothetical protein
MATDRLRQGRTRLRISAFQHAIKLALLDACLRPSDGAAICAATPRRRLIDGPTLQSPVDCK